MPRNRTPRQWREILDAFDRSDLSQAEFCRRRSVALATFRYHRARTRIFVVTGATDMRKGFDGLYGIVANRLGLDPTSGHLFVFCNAARNRIKVLLWDGSGLWVCTKRLEQGRFRWDWDASQSSATIPNEQLSMLLGGVDLKQTQPRRWYRKNNPREADPASTEIAVAS
jgi:transposase